MSTRLVQLRKAKGLSQEELAEALEVTPVTVGRWERGSNQPQLLHLRKLAEVFEVPLEELSLIADPIQELQLEGVEQAVTRLCRDYSSTPPGRLLPWAQQRLAQIDELLQAGFNPDQRRHLLTAKGWLQLLLAALHNDLDQREPAWVARDLALYIGQEVQDRNLVAWAYETPSWFALWDGRARDALDYGEMGLKVAPSGSSGEMMNRLKVAQAHALMGDRLLSERELWAARNKLETWPPPEFPDHHFDFDPAKFHFYASSAYSWLQLPREMEANAREVIRDNGDRRGLRWVPTRVSMARLDLADSLLLRGELEGALAETELALGPFLRLNTLTRADKVKERLLELYPKEPGAAEFSERLAVARGRLGSD